MSKTQQILLCVIFLAGLSLADSWPGPTVRAIVSPDAETVVRILPGESFGDTFGFSGEKTGKFAEAFFYRRSAEDVYERYLQVTLQNPIAPVDAFITDDGILITLDNWHNLGYGRVVAIYRRDGSLLRGYELSALYPDEDSVARLEKSVSSVWWRCGDSKPSISSTQLRLDDSLGGYFVFNLSDGSFLYTGSGGGCSKTD